MCANVTLPRTHARSPVGGGVLFLFFSVFAFLVLLQNLYNNGRVCLSLLGTWRGDGSGEKWTSGSTLLQVLTSIQSLIMTSQVYFNEPGYEASRTQAETQACAAGYDNIVRFATVRYAMRAMLETPPAGFVEIVRLHFYIKRDSIRGTLRQWVEDARADAAALAAHDSGGAQTRTPPKYKSLTSHHNPALSTLFSARPQAYLDMLQTEVAGMLRLLEALEQSPPSTGP